MAKTVYHYTSGDALKSIVENKKIWFSDIRCMNDYGEQEIFLNTIKQEVSFKPFIDLIPKDTIENTDLQMSKLLDKENDKFRCFILSCSLNSDSLPMWNYYSKGCQHGGYNIGFDIKGVATYIYKKYIEKINGAFLFYGNVTYCENNDKIIKSLKNINEYIFGQISIIQPSKATFMDWVENKLWPIILKLSPQNIENESIAKTQLLNEFDAYLKSCENADVTSNPISVYRIDGEKSIKDYFNINNFIKTGDFSYEKEFRFAIVVPTDKITEINKIFADKKPYKTRYQNGMYIPYLEIEIPEKSFTSVKIAPTNFTMKPEENLREFLKSNNVDALVDKSKITVRF